MISYAILEGKSVKLVGSILEVGKWLDSVGLEGKRVAFDKIGEVDVSTIFLGMDHGYPPGPPMWFETMIFGGPHDQYQERYETWEEAERGHAVALALAKGES